MSSNEPSSIVVQPAIPSRSIRVVNTGEHYDITALLLSPRSSVPLERFAAKTSIWSDAVAASNGTQTSASFSSVYTVNTDVSHLRLLMANGTFAATGQFQSDASGGAITVKSTLPCLNNFWHPFGTSLIIDPGCWAWTGVANGSGGTGTNDNYVHSGAALQLRHYITVALGKQWRYTRQQISTDRGTDAVMHSSGDGSDITGSMWVQPGTGQASGGTSTSFSQYCPVAIVGIQETPKPVVALRGDSILNGFGPADGISWAEAAVNDTTALGFGAKLCLNGSTVCNVDQYDPLSAMLAPYADYWVLQWVNDPYNSFTLAQMKAAMLSQAKVLSYGGTRRVILCTLLPRTTSSDNLWNDASKQAVISAPTEAVRTGFNDWARDTSASGAGQQASGSIWAISDPCALIEANAFNAITPNGGLWYCGPNNNTAYCTLTGPGGIHPNTTGRNAMKPALPVASMGLY